MHEDKNVNASQEKCEEGGVKMRVFFVTGELIREIAAVQFLSPSGTKISPFTATPVKTSNKSKQYLEEWLWLSRTPMAARECQLDKGH